MLIIKARCIRIAHSKEQVAEEIEVLSRELPGYQFEENKVWYSDDPPNYPIIVKDSDGNDISDSELEKLTPIADEIMLRNQIAKSSK